MFNRNDQLDELGKYLDCISGGNRSVLSADEELREFEKAKGGDLEATRELIKSNLGLLHEALQRGEAYASRVGVSLCDIAADVLGNLIENRLKTYDPSYGRRIGSYLFDRDFLGREIFRRIKKYSRQGIKFVPMNKEVVSVSPLPEDSRDISEDNVSSEQAAVFHQVSEMQAELLTAADFAAQSIDGERVRGALERLSAVERHVIEQLYFENRQATDLAVEMGLDDQKVRRIGYGAVKKMRAGFFRDIKLSL